MKELILNILRYIFTIPLALVAALLGTTILPYLFVLYIPVGSIAYDIFFFATQNVFFVLLPLMVLYNLPPKKYVKTIATIGIIYCLLWVFAIILEIVSNVFVWEELAKAIIQIITIVSYLLSLPIENKTEVAVESN